MLVLSRRAQQKVVFPHLGISLSVLQVRGRIVKLGIDAPEEVKILRQEVLNEAEDGAEGDTAKAASIVKSSEDSELDHRRRNELNILRLRLAVLQEKITRGIALDVEATLRALLADVSEIDRDFAVAPCPVVYEGRPIRLLVVDDSDNERHLMAYLLASQGFDVHVARDGIEAISLLRLWGTRPDYVLMDINMPLADGLATLSQIREDDSLSSLKVFAVTGSRRNLANEPVGRGWDEWFQKPLDIKALISRLQRDQELPSKTFPSII